jgi:cation:H+ antiporter
LVSILAIILSSAGLAFGSDLLVKNATKIAENFHIDDRIISITLIAFGTSVPELVTSAAAAFKKEMDISIGNIIGSNIFNILCVLGVTSMIKKIEIPAMTMHFDVFWMLGLALLLFLFIIPLKGGRLTQPKGLVLFMVYCVYVYLLFVKM